MGHQRQGAQALFLLQLLHRHAAQRHAAGIAGAAAGQQRRNGALAAAGLTHQRDKAALRDGEGYIVQNGAVLLVAKGDMLQLQGGVFAGQAFAVGGLICLACRLVPALHSDKVIIGDIMLLIPGVLMTNSFRDFISGDMISGLLHFSEAMITAVCVAAGFILSKILLGGML